MADRIKGLSIDLDLDTLKVERGMTGLKDRLKTVNAEMKSNMSAFDRSEKSVSKYETRLKGLNKKIEVQSKITEEAEKKYKEMVEQHGEGSKQAEKAAREYNKQTAELNNLKSYTEGVRKELKDLREEQRLSNSQWTKTGKKLDETGKKMSKIGKGAQSFGKKWTAGMAIAGGAVAGLGVSLFALTNKVTENADAIAKGADRMGVSTDFYQEMDYWASQNGISQQSMERAIQRTNRRMGEAVAGNEKYADALEAMGVNMADVRDGSITTEDAFAQSIQTLSEMENEQEKNALASEFFGKKLSNELLPALQDGSLSIEEAKKKAEELGIVMSDDQLSAAEAFQDAQDDIKRSLAGVVNSIGLEVMPHFQKMLDWILANLPQIRETISKAMDQVIERISAFMKWWRELSDGAKRWLGIAAAVTAAIGPMAFAFGTLLRVAGPITSLFGKLFQAIAKVGGFMPALKIAFGALTGPIGLTVAGIAALVAGFTIAYKKSESFRAIVHQVKDAFVGAFEKVKEFLTTNPQFLVFIDSVKEGFQKAKQIIMDGFGIALDFVQEKIGQVKAFWASDGQQLLLAFQNIFSGIWAVVKPILDALVAAFQWAFPYMKTIFSGAFKLVLAIAKSIIGNIKGIIDGGLNFILGLAKTFSGLFTGDFSKMWEGIKQLFKGAIQFVWNFVQLSFFGKLLKGVGVFAKSFGGFFKSLWSSVQNIFKTVITSIWNFFKNRFSSLLNTGKSIFSSLRDSAKVIWNATKNNIVNPIKNAYTSTTNRIGNLRDKGVEIFRNMRDKVKGVFDDMVTAIKNLPGRMRDGLKDNAKKIASGVKQVSKFLLEGLEKGINGVGKGINWILKKVNAPKKLHIPTWEIPAYKTGTDNHPGGLARVSDGEGPNKQELIRLPQGQLFLSPPKEAILNLPKGSSVLDGNSTAELMKDGVIPAYKDGKGILQRAWGGLKKAGKKVKDTALTVWDFAKDPLSLIESAVSEFTNLLRIKEPAKGMTKGVVKKATGGAKAWIKKLFEDGGGSFMGSGDAPGNVKSWITSAMDRIGVPSNWLGPLTTIAMKESGGRTGPSTVNRWDSNWRRGTPSMGLMQTIRPTFEAYKASGWNDIMNPVHNAAAAINYIKSRYGNVFNVPGIRALRQGRRYVGYKTGARISTPGTYNFAEDGWPEYAISTNPARRTDSMKLLALAGKEIQGNKRPNQLPDPGPGGFSAASLQTIIDKLEKQVENTNEIVQLLMKLLLKETDIQIDGYTLAKVLKRYLDDQNTREKERRGEFVT